jgi:general secretion pathway protein K
MVLLLVLVVIALLSVLLSEFAFSTLVDLRLTETFRDTTRADYLARGGITVGRMMLQDDKNEFDAPEAGNELWARGVDNFPVAEGAISIHITDLDGRINLNLLVDSQGNPDVVFRDRFFRLCELLGLDDPEGLTAALVDWIDPDKEAEPAGAEESYYLGLQPAYPAANERLGSLDELARVRGYDSDIVMRLAPFVSVQGSGKLNVNSATREVLLAWDAGLTEAAAEALITDRQSTPLKSLDALKELLGIDIFSALNRNLDLAVTSRIYHIATRGEVGSGIRRLEAIVDKTGNLLLWQKVN